MNNQKIRNKTKFLFFSLLVASTLLGSQASSVSAAPSLPMKDFDAVSNRSLTDTGVARSPAAQPHNFVYYNPILKSTVYFVLSILFLLFVVNFIVIKKQQNETKLRGMMLVTNILAAIIIFFFLGAFVMYSSWEPPVMVT